MTADEVYDRHELLPLVERFFDERNPERYHAGDYHQALAKDLVAFAELPPASRVLDLASGTGLVAFEAAKVVGTHGHVLGIDISRGMQSFAKAHAELEGLDRCVQFRRGDVEDLSSVLTDDESFDTILCASSLPYLSDAPQALRHWRGFLRDGGSVAVTGITTTSVITGVLMQRAARKFGLELPEWSKDTADEETCRALLLNSGYDDVEIEVKEYGGLMRKDQAKKAFDGSLLQNPLVRQLNGLRGEEREQLLGIYRDEVDAVNPGEESVWNPNTNFLVKGVKRSGRM